MGLLGLMASGCSMGELGETPDPVVSDTNAISAPSTLWTTSFSDALGWNGLNYANSIRLGDVNGDGKADVCGRGSSGIDCALSNGNGFAAPRLWTTSYSDIAGWNNEVYANTIQLGDLNGDGKADICGRGAGGVYCSLSTGDTFGTTALWTQEYGDRDHWNWATYYNAIRLADVDGDGKADICGRGQPGIFCSISRGDSFAPASLWSDYYQDASWKPARWSNSFQLGDIDADGKADACMRGIFGVVCSSSTGSSFGQPLSWQAVFRDFTDTRFGELTNANTIRLGDMDGDGSADLCGRAPDGFICALSDGRTAFAPATMWSDELRNGTWTPLEYSDTVQVGDVNGDHRADVCARSAAGIRCWVSTATPISACGVGDHRFSIDGLRGSSMTVDNGINYAVYGDPLFFTADLTSHVQDVTPVRLWLNGRDLGPGSALGRGTVLFGGTGDIVTSSTPDTMTLTMQTPCGTLSRHAPVTKIVPTAPTQVTVEATPSTVTRGGSVTVRPYWNGTYSTCRSAHTRVMANGLDQIIPETSYTLTFTPQSSTTVTATRTCDAFPSLSGSGSTSITVQAPPVCYPQVPGFNTIRVENQGLRGRFAVWLRDYTAGTQTMIFELDENTVRTVTVPECHIVDVASVRERCQAGIDPSVDPTTDLNRVHGNCLDFMSQIVGRTDGSWVLASF
jgi:hypothetical protein